MENSASIDSMIDEAREQSKNDQLLNDVDVGYIKECIFEQIDDVTSSSEKVNYIKMMKSQIDDIEGIEKEYVDIVCDGFYTDVLNKIGEKFGFTVDDTEVNKEIMCKNIYKFFILHYAKNISMFLEMAILDDQHTIIKELKNSAIDKGRMEDIPNDFAMIIRNISDAVNVISGMDYTFENFINFICEHEDSKPSATEVCNYYNNGYLSDTEDIVPTIIKSLINEDEGFGEIYTELRSNLIQRFRNN